MRPGNLQQGTLTHGILTGALLGFGIQQGTPARLFNAVASLVLGDRADRIWGFHPVVTVVGVIVHVALTFGWGLLFARVAGGMRGLRLAGAAVSIAAAALAVDVLIITRLLSVDLSDVLAPSQVIALHVVLGVALGVGMRLATSYLWSD